MIGKKLGKWMLCAGMVLALAVSCRPAAVPEEAPLPRRSAPDSLLLPARGGRETLPHGQDARKNGAKGRAAGLFP